MLKWWTMRQVSSCHRHTSLALSSVRTNLLLFIRCVSTIWGSPYNCSDGLSTVFTRPCLPGVGISMHWRLESVLAYQSLLFLRSWARQVIGSSLGSEKRSYVSWSRTPIPNIFPSRPPVYKLFGLVRSSCTDQTESVWKLWVLCTSLYLRSSYPLLVWLLWCEHPNP